MAYCRKPLKDTTLDALSRITLIHRVAHINMETWTADWGGGDRDTRGVRGR